MRRTYLDNAATTPMLFSVKKAIIFGLETFGNASSMYEEGRQAWKVMNNARETIAMKIGAKPNEIIFTSGGSEANNMVLNSFADKNIAVSAIEHPSILEPAKKFKSKIIPVDKLGRIKTIDIPKSTDLVSVMFANNEIGTIQDIKKVAEIAHKSGALFHTDAVQAFGKIPINVDEFGIDYMTMSAHKIGGPKGVGALYVREGSPLLPLIVGGGQENGLRSGTENILAILGFAEAVRNYKFSDDSLRKKLREEIIKQIPNVIINGDQNNCIPSILNVTFAGIEGESILLKLNGAGISVSTGSACATKDIKSSHVLMAIGADPEKAHGSIRFSFAQENTQKDIDKVMSVLPGIVSGLRKMSTIGGKYE